MLASPPSLSLYAGLNRIALLDKNYTAKIMAIAFLGTHIPLLALLASFLFFNAYSWDVALGILTIALGATLVGTGLTLYVLKHLLVPVALTAKALKTYRDCQVLEPLPITFTDEAGQLMADTAKTLKELDSLIHYVTHYDDVTGLPKRDLFSHRLMEVLAGSQNPQQLVAVIVLGVDDFVNLSHALDKKSLDRLLRAVTQRLKDSLGPNTLLTYLGQDEFAVALLELSTLEKVITSVQLLLTNLGKSFMLDHQPIHMTASAGITIMGLGQEEATQETDVIDAIDQLLQQAQITLHQSQQEGRSQYGFYSPELNAQLQERLTLENALYDALEQDELVVYYQPLYHLQRGNAIAVEALVRWQHPTLGLIPPSKFVPLAEANGLIVPIGEWVLRTACAQGQAWRRAGLPPLRISVNLSARQFEQPDLVATVEQILAETAMDPQYLELEVTESALIADVQHSIHTLTQLRQLGIAIALDDFGTGYSSLSYLKQFPVTMLKIDRSFVTDVTTNPDSAAVTDAIIALANSLGLSITAEGIETPEQLQYLQQRGCQEGQGYYLGRPAPAAAIVQQLSQTILVAA